MKKEIALLLSIFVASVLAACGHTDAESPALRLDAVTAAKTITAEFETIMDSDAESNALTRTLSEGFSLEVQEIQETDEGYTVRCILSNYDVAAALDEMNASTEELTLDQYTEKLVQALKQGDQLTTEAEFAFSEAADGAFSTVFTEEQLDAATGGLLTASEKWIEG